MDITAKIDNLSGVKLATNDKVCTDDILVRLDGNTIAALRAENIKKGVTICGVTGAYDGLPVDYSDQTNLEKIGQTIMKADARRDEINIDDFFATRGIPDFMQKVTPIGGAPRVMASRVIQGAAGTAIGSYYRVTEAATQDKLTQTSIIDYYIAYDDERIYFAIRDIGGFENSIYNEIYSVRNNYTLRLGLDLSDYSRVMTVLMPYSYPSNAEAPNFYNVKYFDAKSATKKLELNEGVIERLAVYKTTFGGDINDEVTTDKAIMEWDTTVQVPDIDVVVEGNSNYWKPYVLYAKYVFKKADLIRYWNEAFGTNIELSNKFFIAMSCSCYGNDGRGSIMTIGTPFYGTILNSEEITALGKRCPILPDVIKMYDSYFDGSTITFRFEGLRDWLVSYTERKGITWKTWCEKTYWVEAEDYEPERRFYVTDDGYIQDDWTSGYLFDENDELVNVLVEPEIKSGKYRFVW